MKVMDLQYISRIALMKNTNLLQYTVLQGKVSLVYSLPSEKYWSRH